MYLQCILIGLISLFIVGLQHSTVHGASIPSKKPLTTIRVQQCREGCLEKFAIKESLCQQRPECSTSGFPPYNYNSLPDALHLLCWDECAKPPPPKLNKSIRETWALRTVSMLQQDSLVLVDVAWSPLNTPNQCLVTWEVSGGGLMGNLLTETFNVQLSLWPDTKYRVQVTCKNKLTGSMSRSLPLNIDTSEAITTHLPPNNIKSIQHLQQTTNTLISSNTNSPSSSSSSSSSMPLPTNIDHQLLSFDDQSNESINHHTNFIFNWHHNNAGQITKKNHNHNNNNNDDIDTIVNSDVQVNRIEHLNQSGLNILTIAAISDMQKPLIFGVIAGSLLLTVILFLYICMLRSQRIPSDKAALIEDDGCVITATTTNTQSPTETTQSVGTTTQTTLTNPNIQGCGIINHFGIDPSISLNPGYYSKTVHVLAV